MDADTQLQYIMTQVIAITSNRLIRMNSLCTDTYATMRSLWTKIRLHRDLKHVFVVPCDPHGIQLFLKDILGLSWFKRIMKQAQQIVRSFRAAHKEYSLLRNFQMEILGKKVALILHCITRWGSQVGMLNSVLANQRVLELYSQQAHPQIDANKKNKETHVLPILQDLGFWQDAARIQRILKPIHEIQYLSESDNYPLYRVLDNWMQIKISIMRLSQERGMESANIPHIANTLWDDRYLHQINQLHVAAYLLVPNNHAKTTAGQSPFCLSSTFSDAVTPAKFFDV